MRRPPSPTLFPYTTLFRSFARLWHGLLAYLVKFGVVGLIGLVIDVVLFNLLRLGVFGDDQDRKSTRLNSSHVEISYAVFCLKKKTYITSLPLSCKNLCIIF